jgi:hypothetical protein
MHGSCLVTTCEQDKNTQRNPDRVVPPISTTTGSASERRDSAALLFIRGRRDASGAVSPPSESPGRAPTQIGGSVTLRPWFRCRSQPSRGSK